MKPHRLEQLAKLAGMVQGPWANGAKERIWQESRDFPDALEVFASLIAKECVSLIQGEINHQVDSGTDTNVTGLNQAIFTIRSHFDIEQEK